MKTVFWTIVSYKKNSVLVRYWKQPDQSDALSASIPKSSESGELRKVIEEVTGLKHFNLVYTDENDNSQ